MKRSVSVAVRAVRANACPMKQNVGGIDVRTISAKGLSGTTLKMIGPSVESALPQHVRNQDV